MVEMKSIRLLFQNYQHPLKTDGDMRCRVSKDSILKRYCAMLTHVTFKFDTAIMGFSSIDMSHLDPLSRPPN